MPEWCLAALQEFAACGSSITSLPNCSDLLSIGANGCLQLNIRGTTGSLTQLLGTPGIFDPATQGITMEVRFTNKAPTKEARAATSPARKPQDRPAPNLPKVQIQRMKLFLVARLPLPTTSTNFSTKQQALVPVRSITKATCDA